MTPYNTDISETTEFLAALAAISRAVAMRIDRLRGL